MRLRMWRERLSRGRGDWGLEQAWLLLAAMMPVGLGVQGPPGLATAARRQRSPAHQAQALVHVQGPAPPRQLRPQALDLLPQSMVVFFQRLVLLQGEAEGQGGSQPAPGAPTSPTHRLPSAGPQGSQRGKRYHRTPMCKLGPWATSGQPPTITPKSPPIPPPPGLSRACAYPQFPRPVASPGLLFPLTWELHQPPNWGDPPNHPISLARGTTGQLCH